MMKYQTTFLSHAIHIGLMMATCVTTSAFANDTNQNKRNNEPVELDAITVTAQNSYVLTETDSAIGLNLSPKETPQSFSTLTEKQMKDQNVQYLKDALKQGTGVNAVAFDGKRIIFSSRGFQIEKFFVDGLDVNFTQSQSTGENLANIGIYDHISIVRGSTGLLSGSGEPSAAINLQRKRATSKELSGEISANANNFSNYGAMLDLGSALNQSGSMRGRIVASHQDGDSYVDREKRGFSTLYGVIDADIGENTQVGVGYSYQKTKWRESMWGGLPIYYTDGSRIDWDVGKNVSAHWSIWDTTNKTFFADLKHHLNNGWEFSIKGSHSDNSGDPTLMYARGAVDKNTGILWETDQSTGMLTGNVSSSATWSVTPTKFHLGRKQTSLQTDLKGDFDAFGRTHEFVLGADFSKARRFAYYYDDSNPAATLPSYYGWDGSYTGRTFGAIDPSLGYTDIKTKESGIYGTLRLKPTERLAVITGLRVSNFDRKGTDWKELTFKKSGIITPYGGVVFDINPNHAIYASYASIYKPQDDAIGTNGELLDPKKGNTVEIGLKSSTTDGRLTAQLALFKMKQKNYPVDSTVPMPNSRPWRPVYYKEGKDATSHGIEIEVAGQFSEQIHATLGFSHFKVKDGQGLAMLTTHPTTKFNAFTTYNPNFAPNLTLGAGATWTSKRYGTVNNPATGVTERITQKPVFLANLMAKYQFNKNLDIQLNINNVFDKKYFDINDQFDQIMYQEPFSTVGKITYKF